MRSSIWPSSSARAYRRRLAGARQSQSRGREVEGHSREACTGVEGETMASTGITFIKMLSERGFTDDQIGLMLGGNYLRVWKQILPGA